MSSTPPVNKTGMKPEEFELLENGTGQPPIEDGLASFYSDDEEEMEKGKWVEEGGGGGSYQSPGSEVHNGGLPLPVTSSHRFGTRTGKWGLIKTSIAVILIWITSITIIILSKLLLTPSRFETMLQFPHPLLLGWYQQLILLVVSVGLGELGNKVKLLGQIFPPFDFDLVVMKKLLPLSLIQLIMVMLSNVSLFYTEVTFYQVASTLSLIFTLVLERTMFNQQVTTSTLLTCLVIALGFTLSSVGEKGVTLGGLVSGIAFSFFTSLYGVYLKKSVSHVKNQWILLHYTTATTVVLSFPVLLLSGELTRAAYSPSVTYPSSWWFMTGLGSLTFLYHLATFYQPGFVTPLATASSWSVKESIQAILATVLFHPPLTALNRLGIAMVIIGSTLTTFLRHLDRTRT